MHNPDLKLSPFALAAMLLAAASAASAQSQPAAATDTTDSEIQTVVISASADASAGGLTKDYAGGQVARGGRLGLLGNVDMMDTPFNTLNFTQAVIQDQQARSVADVLQNDPSVRVARGFGNYQELYVIRGFPVTRTTWPITVYSPCCRASLSLPNCSNGSKCCAAQTPSSTARRRAVAAWAARSTCCPSAPATTR